MLRVATQQTDDGPVQRHVNGTFYTLRWGVAAVGLAFPFALWAGGQALADLPLQPSMSDYYHAAPEGASSGVMRDWFVGFLFALAAPLYLYKGFTKFENCLLNAAGAFAIGVAIFPTSPEPSASFFSLHGAFAIGAFACLALVAWFSPGRSLRLMDEGPKRTRYCWAYWLSAVWMVALPLLAWYLLRRTEHEGVIVFVVEALALMGFVAYWVTKSLEMRETDGEVQAIRGGLDYSKGAAS